MQYTDFTKAFFTFKISYGFKVHKLRFHPVAGHMGPEGE
jgi:hypothetical protein